MKPLFLGSAERQLYGVYHPPARPGRSAVLLCYPGMQEYNAAHWAFRRLASMLSRDGHHVLRFDYFGTGDSAGASADGNPEEWIEDVTVGAQELRDQSGAREISVIGMRLGATLAFLASAGGLQVKRLLLWEPVTLGSSYVSELELADAQRNLQLLHARETRGRRHELLGHVFSSSVRNATERLNLLRGPLPMCEEAVIVTAEQRPEHEALRDKLAVGGIPARINAVQEPGAGSKKEVRERALLSTAVLVELARELNGAAS